MKSKLILSAIILTTVLSLFACTPATQQISVDITCDDFAASNNIINEFEFRLEGSLTVTLCSNPTTGFEWTMQISDPVVLQEVSHEFVPPEDEGVPGAAGKEIWTFKTLNAGETKIYFEYSQPWEGGEKKAWTYEVTAVVR